MKKLMTWDECDLIEQQVTCCKEYPENARKTEEEIRSEVYSDNFFLSDCWDDFLTDLDNLISEINPNGKWAGKVKNFGWRSLSGYKEFDADNGKDFLRQILPDTDCTFNIFKFKRKGFAIQNFHHDSPTGKEWYYIVPLHLKKNLKEVA